MKALTFIAAGLAASANAFLLPPGVSLDKTPKIDVDDVNEPAFHALPFQVETVSEIQNVKVNCPGCPIVLQGHAGQLQRQHGASHIELAVAVAHDVAHDRLLINGFELYPNSDPLASTLAAAVFPDYAEGEMPATDVPVGVQELGFSLMSRTMAKGENGDFVEVEIQVIEVGNKFVSDLDSIRINLLATNYGSIIINSIDLVPAEPAKPASECTTLSCKWKAFVNDYVSKIKPAFKSCAGKMGHHGHGGKGAENQGNGMVAGGPKMHHNHHHSWAGLFHKFGHTILLPILIGIVAGISVSLIGMVVGTVLIGTWRVFVRGQPFFRGKCPHRRRHSHSHSHNKLALRHAAQAAAMEKTALMDDQEEDVAPPPSYQDEDTKPADSV